MDGTLTKLREAIDYAKEQRSKCQSELNESSGESSGGGVRDTKDLHDEHIDGLNKKITYLNGEIDKMEDAVKQIEELQGKQEVQENVQEESHGKGK